MSELVIKDKDVVTPGEELAKGMDYLPSTNTFREGESIYANKLGLLRVEGKVLKVVPLSGEYAPKTDDTIICQVKDILLSGWNLNTFSPYTAVLNVKDGVSTFVKRGADLSRFYQVGDYVSVRIFNVTSQKLIDVSMRGPGLGKLDAARVVRVNSNKVPRIIGKQGSMVSLIKEHTGASINVGQNGVILVKAEDPKKEIIAVEAIKKIEAEAHHAGLTETIQQWLVKQ